MAASSTSSAITVTVRKWSPVGYWKFPVNISENCGICRESLEKKCLECGINDGSKCGISYGQCNHIYHICCINGWTKDKTNSNCPQCFQPWATEKEETIE